MSSCFLFLHVFAGKRCHNVNLPYQYISLFALIFASSQTQLSASSLAFRNFLINLHCTVLDLLFHHPALPLLVIKYRSTVSAENQVAS